MTSYRLFPATSGPSTPVSFGGTFLAAVDVAIKGGGNWFEGYWWWVCPTGQSTDPVECALWCADSSSAGTLVAGSNVTSGTLTAGQWNYIPLPEPIPLAPSYDPNESTMGGGYVACVSFTGNFPDTAGFWGTGGPGVAGIINGPLVAYSGLAGEGGTLPGPYGLVQGLFSEAANAHTAMPVLASSVDNFWVDVQISDTAPDGYDGTIRLLPNKSDANPSETGDAAVDYVIALEIEVTATVDSVRVWYFSPPGTAQLATWAGVWEITGPDSGTLISANTSPTWSGAAGSGWVSTPLTGTFPAANYKVAIYNDAETPDAWSAKDANSAYCDLGVGHAGIDWGIIKMPNLSSASQAYAFDTSGGSNTPPFSDGTSTTIPGQPTFSQPASGLTEPAYPYLVALVDADTDPTNAVHSQFYFVDWDVEDATPPVSGTGAVTAQPAELAGTGTETFAGTGAVTAGTVTLSGSGTVTEPPGSGAVTAAAVVLAGAGTVSMVPVDGPGAVTAPVAQLAGSGSVGISGSVITTRVIPHAGLTLSAADFHTAAVGGDQAATGPGLLLIVSNTDTAAHTVTLPVPEKVDSLGVTSRVVTVPAGTLAYIPLQGLYRDPMTGLSSFGYDATTGVTVAVVRVVP